MDLVEFNGLMEKSMKGTGDKVFKMEKEKYEVPMEMSVKEFGKMAKESNDNFFYFNILFYSIN